MKAKPGVVEALNTILTNELTAINQYFVQARMCQNWGYERLAHQIRAISLDEMKDTEQLIDHILYLEGVPNLQRLNRVRVGETVLENLQLDLALEQHAVATLTEAIALCAARCRTTPHGTSSRRWSATRRPTWTGSRPSWRQSSRSAWSFT